MLPTYQVAPLLRSGELVELLPAYTLDELGIHAVYASRRQQSAIMRRFLDFLKGPQARAIIRRFGYEAG